MNEYNLFIKYLDHYIYRLGGGLGRLSSYIKNLAGIKFNLPVTSVIGLLPININTLSIRDNKSFDIPVVIEEV